MGLQTSVTLRIIKRHENWFSLSADGQADVAKQVGTFKFFTRNAPNNTF